MEALSPTMEEGQVVRWLKSEGDEVSSGDILAEIETDKATMELVARGDGLLRTILLGEGGTAAVGTVIGVIAGAEEDIVDLIPADGAGSTAPAPETSPRPDGAPPPAPDGDGHTPPAVDAPPPAPGERIKASPVARRLAEADGLPLEAIAGSGPGGRIVKRDVVKAAERRVAPVVPSPLPDADFEDVPLTQMRKTIAKRLVESIGPVPHFFLTVDVDMSRTVDARRRFNARLEKEGVRISINDIVLKAAAVALRRHPECNAHWGGNHVRRFNRVHLGVAVAIDDGLITPVVTDADRKGLAQIALEVRELASRAREKRLTPEEYTGATFSVSNLGMFGIHEFTGVINPPEAGILAVGAVADRPVAVDGAVRVRPQMKMTMSCDHRVIDGAQGSRFLATLQGILEEPLLALA